jgi:hypothetical protein
MLAHPAPDAEAIPVEREFQVSHAPRDVAGGMSRDRNDAGPSRIVVLAPAAQATGVSPSCPGGLLTQKPPKPASSAALAADRITGSGMATRA